MKFYAVALKMGQPGDDGMKRKLLRLWIHYRRNAPLIQTFIVVLGIFALFQNCGRSSSPRKMSTPQTSIPTGGSIGGTTNGNPVNPTDTSLMRFPITTDAQGNALFFPGHPFGLAMDSANNLAIAAFSGPVVSCSASSGICSSVETQAANPIGVVILPDSRIAYIDYKDRSLHMQVINPVARGYEWQVTSLGITPYGVALNPDGTKAYISSEQGDGVVCTLGTFDTRTSCAAHRELTGFDISVSESGSVYLANATSLKVCDDSLTRCTSYAFPDGRTMAVGVAVGSAIFVSDYLNARILKCTIDQSALTCSDFVTRLNVPRTIRLDSSGNLYIAEYNSNSVLKVDPTGNR